jgi:hypothetical protein
MKEQFKLMSHLLMEVGLLELGKIVIYQTTLKVIMILLENIKDINITSQDLELLGLQQIKML